MEAASTAESRLVRGRDNEVWGRQQTRAAGGAGCPAGKRSPSRGCGEGHGHALPTFSTVADMDYHRHWERTTRVESPVRQSPHIHPYRLEEECSTISVVVSLSILCRFRTECCSRKDLENVLLVTPSVHICKQVFVYIYIYI